MITVISCKLIFPCEIDLPVIVSVSLQERKTQRKESLTGLNSTYSFIIYYFYKSDCQGRWNKRKIMVIFDHWSHMTSIFQIVDGVWGILHKGNTNKQAVV